MKHVEIIPRRESNARRSSIIFFDTSRRRSSITKNYFVDSDMHNKAIQELEQKLLKANCTIAVYESENERLGCELMQMREKYAHVRDIVIKNVWYYTPEHSEDFVHLPLVDDTIVETNQSVHDYIIHDEVGRGQFSVVKKCMKEVSLKDACGDIKKVTMDAIKIIQKADILSVSSLLRIENELKTLKILKNHKNILQFIDCYNTKSSLYIITELLPYDLFDFIENHHRNFNDNVCAVILSQIVDGVAHMNYHEIAHRDLKPENILVSLQKNTVIVKLCDFGLSITIPTGNTLSEFCGSPGFFAPECLLLEKYDGYKADVFSIGAVGVELATSQSFFSNKWMMPYRLLQSNSAPDYKKCLEDTLVLTYDEIKRRFLSSITISNFLNSCIQIDPKRRPTVQSCQKINWLKNANHATAADVLNGLPPRKVLALTMPTSKKDGSSSMSISASMPLIATPSSSGYTTPANSTPSHSSSTTPAASRNTTPRRINPRLEAMDKLDALINSGVDDHDADVDLKNMFISQ